MAASPSNADQLALDREARTIQQEVGHSLELVTRWAAQPLDLLRELRKLRPSVLHFAGHGAATGVYFQDENARAKPVATEAIITTISAAGDSLVLVVLNACYTADLAHRIAHNAESTRCVIGTPGSIGDVEALAFSRGFYRALANGASIGAAYVHGCSAPGLEDLPPGNFPAIETLGDPHKIFIRPRT